MITRKSQKYDKQREREIEKAISSFSQYLMSNSKWVRLMELIENANDIKKVQFKVIQDDNIRELSLDDYGQTGFENGRDGSFGYKEVEFLIFPRIVNIKNDVIQDLKQIMDSINSIGLFALDIDEERLLLTCYR